MISSLLDKASLLAHRCRRFLGDPDSMEPLLTLKSRDRYDALLHPKLLLEYLPYRSYSPGSGLHFGRGWVGFCLEMTPLVGVDDIVLQQIDAFFKDHMVEGSALQLLLFADPQVEKFLEMWSAPRVLSGGVYERMAKKRVEKLRLEKDNPLLYRSIISYSVQNPGDAFLSEAAEGCRKALESLLVSLNNMTGATVLGASDLLSMVPSLIHPTSERFSRRYNPLDDLSAQMYQDSSIHAQEEQTLFRREGKELAYRSLIARDFPPAFSLAETQGLVGHLLQDKFRPSHPGFVHWGIFVPNQSAQQKAFSLRATMTERQAAVPWICRTIPSLEREYHEVGEVRRSLERREKIVFTQLSAGVWAPEEKINSASKRVREIFEVNGISLKSADKLHLAHHLSCLPMSWASTAQDMRLLGQMRRTTERDAMSYMPLQAEWSGTKTPGMLLQGRLGQVINWNPFDSDGNYNVVVSGASGSGKSVFMQDLVLSGLSTGARVFVFDAGRSFEKLCSVLGGQHLRFHPRSSLRMNPFSQIPRSEEEQPAYLDMLRDILAGMSNHGEGIQMRELNLLREAIDHSWRSKRDKASIKDVIAFLETRREDFANDLLWSLKGFGKDDGEGRFFLGESNVELSSDFVVIELEDLNQNPVLQSAVLQTLIMNIASQVYQGDRERPFYLIIDEAWQLLQGERTGTFIEGMARKLRKYRGSLVVGTQNVDDFFKSCGAKAAFDNSDWHCMLHPKPDALKRLADSNMMSLTEHEVAIIRSLRVPGPFSEVLIKHASGMYYPAKLSLDRFSRLLFSSKAEEFRKIDQLKRSGMSVEEAIEKVLSNDE